VSSTRLALGLSSAERKGTVVGPEGPIVDSAGEHTIECGCGCGGYWIVEWDFLKAPHNRIVFLAHDLKLEGIIDQLGFRAEGP
jgi:hypothetical protein